MANSHQCDFFLIRYVPDLVKGEFVNVGVALVEGSSGFADVRITRDWRRVRCLDPDADVEYLQALEEEIRQVLRSSVELDRAFIYEKLPDWASNGLQLTPMQGVVTDSPQEEIGRLADMYCEPPKRSGRREVSARQVIFGAMRGAFEQAGVWELMRKRIAVSQYTHKGDPLRLDCGYRPNGVVHLFQAVSLATDVDSAKVLAFSYPQIREGIARLENAKTSLTAVVEDDLDRGDDAIGFALETFENTSILVATTSELPQIAQRARMEMRV